MHDHRSIAINAEHLPLYVSAPKGVAVLLRGELRELGASKVRLAGAGVSARATLAVVYRICLWSRCASRVLLELARFRATDSDALYAGAVAVDWPGLFACEATFAVRATLRNAGIRHSGFAAQRVKDAVADTFRAATGARPSVARRDPDIGIHLHIDGHDATLSLDLAGHSLHQRGYRGQAGAAPLKENLAAALLLRADWRSHARTGASLLDPMCGSGTLLVEALLDAARMAPGLARESFGFMHWSGHDQALWQEQRTAALGAARLEDAPLVYGFDIDSASLRLAEQAAERAGVAERAVFEKRALVDAAPPAGSTAGLLITNPPYGERLGGDELPALYTQLGQAIRRFAGWHAFVFSGNPGLVHRLRLKPRHRYAMFNGALPCELLDLGSVAAETAPVHAPPAPVLDTHDPFTNRLRKNLRNVGKWARRNGVSCYRLYDADLPDYAFAVDLYSGDTSHLMVQEYAPPRGIDENRAAARREHALEVLQRELELPAAHIHYRARQRQRGDSQYDKLDSREQFEIVAEGGLCFYVNFTDYLDCGLFIDHRQTRSRLRDYAHGKRFLNLYCYTGSATVYAAAGGAVSTTSVDLSNTYLAWTRRNLALNDFDTEAHETIRADCLAWSSREARDGHRRWQLIFVDPPSFSNSARMHGSFDVQRDHATLIHHGMRLLSDDGVLVFSTNRRGFKLAVELEQRFAVTDITQVTRSRDFSRRSLHRCWEMRHRDRESRTRSQR